MQLFYEFARIVRLIPIQVRWLSSFFIILPVIFILSRTLGLRTSVALWIVGGVLVLMALIWAIGGLKRLRDRKRSQDFESDLGMHSKQGPASQEEIREAVRELQDQWQSAAREFKSRGTSLYELPWFLLIGEPQSGKSTTLRESGLEFPIGLDAIPGSGGTRNCDWWFTEDAVILDTAGRFSFQEATAPDRQEWDAFLGLLGKHRKECPINGALVVIPATSLMEDPPEEQEKKAKNIRKKLMQLQNSLNIRFPIFILITKADRILGFAEFFQNLNPSHQHQIYGWSNPNPYDQRWDPKAVGDIFDEITQRTHKTRLRYLHKLDDTDKVDRMYVFPEELAAVREPLEHYLYHIFHGSRWEEPFIFRGFYFTSGLQEGRPIARACQDLLRVSSGDPQGVLEDLETTFHRSRAFFIKDFYEKKVFPEKGLVKRTEAALKKDRVYRRVFWGMIGAAGLAAVFLLAPAVLNLMKKLGPINQLTADATECLEKEVQCGVLESYELVYDIEQARTDLAKENWTMRLMLQGNQRNEIVNELLPTIQAGLLRKGVLRPVLESFEARADPDLWRTGEGFDYELYLAAFQDRLRFDQYQWIDSPQNKGQLREQTHLGNLLRFIHARTGMDTSDDGEEIDDWLKDTSHLGDIEEADRIFRSVITANERFDLMKVGKLSQPLRGLETFEQYWSIEALARWNFELIDKYFKVYQESYDGILRLDPRRKGGSTSLASYSELGRRLGDAYTQGTAYMAERSRNASGKDSQPQDFEEVEDLDEADEAEDPDVSQDDSEDDGKEDRRRRRRRRVRQAVEDIAEGEVRRQERPGPDVESWTKLCSEDFAQLRGIFDRLTKKAHIQEHCGVTIPNDWNQLVADRSHYEHLYDDVDVDGRPALRWSEGAREIQAPLVELAALADRDLILEQASEFKTGLDQRTGDRDRLAAIKNFASSEQERLRTPVLKLSELEQRRYDDRFRLDEARDQASMIAAVATGLLVLPPTDEFLAEKFRTDCPDCFTLDHAKTYVPPTNALLKWSFDALGQGRSVPDLQDPIENIHRSVYAYLETFIGRDRVTGTGFQLPHSAAAARDWSRFLDAVRRWQLTAGSEGVRSESGLTTAVLRDFIQGNDRLRPLLKSFEGRKSSTPVKIPRDLERAIDAYKATLDRLEGDPLTAWKQLALGEDGCSLEDFHAFSRSRGLKRNRQATWLKEKVEDHGAQLLSDAIRPLFDRKADPFWAFQDRCCRDRFPFIDELKLRRMRRAYEHGYHEGKDLADLWRSPKVESGRRVVRLPMTLETVSKDDLDRLFFSGGQLDRLFEEFAVDPILELDADGRPKTTVDFLSPDTGKLRILRSWQRFFYGDPKPGQRNAKLLDDQSFEIKIIEGKTTEGRTYLGEEVSQVDLFGPYAIRPSVDAKRGIVRTVPLKLDNNPLSIVGRDEDTNGWTGTLEIQGGPLKLLYFVQLAAEKSALEDGRVWTLRIEVPNFENPQQRLEGVFEVEFERAVPGVFPAPGRSSN